MNFKKERTYVMIKPDGVKKGLTGEVIARLERAGLKLVALKMVEAEDEVLGKHYQSENEEYLKSLGNKTLKTYKEYNKDAKADLGTDDPLALGHMIMGWLLDYIKSGPLVAMIFEGMHAVNNVRTIAGPTMPVDAPGGTIRGDFSLDSAAYANMEKRGVANIIHASGSPEEAEVEIGLWFSPTEIYEYKSAHDLLSEHTFKK